MGSSACWQPVSWSWPPSTPSTGPGRRSAPATRFEGVLGEALAHGYRGIRVVADNTPLVRGDDESFRRWLAWEQLTDRFQSKSMVTGVCFFDHAALSGAPS